MYMKSAIFRQFFALNIPTAISSSWSSSLDQVAVSLWLREQGWRATADRDGAEARVAGMQGSCFMGIVLGVCRLFCIADPGDPRDAR